MVRIHFPSLTAGKPAHPLSEALGDSPPVPGGEVQRRRLDELMRRAREFFVNAGPDDADVWIFPHELTDPGVDRAISEARRLGKPLLFFQTHDNSEPSRVSWGTVYRDSAFASKLAPHERIMPALCNDPLELELDVECPFDPVPTVGFCGYVGLTPLLAAYRMAGRAEKAVGLELRRRALAALR